MDLDKMLAEEFLIRTLQGVAYEPPKDKLAPAFINPNKQLEIKPNDYYEV